MLLAGGSRGTSEDRARPRAQPTALSHSVGQANLMLKESPVSPAKTGAQVERPLRLQTLLGQRPAEGGTGIAGSLGCYPRILGANWNGTGSNNKQDACEDFIAPSL
jgi:hypothetical protein